MNSLLSRNVSNKELTTLQKDKIIRVMEKGERAVIPYRRVITDYSVLGIIVSAIGGCFGFQLFMQFGPLYLNKVCKTNVSKASLFRS
jgi:hypothetical protein